MSTAEELAASRALIKRQSDLNTEIAQHVWPSLELVEVVDEQYPDEPTIKALRCPWCNADLIPGGGLHAVDRAERWTYIGSSSDFEEGTLELYSKYADFEATEYYAHDYCEMPCSLPEGFEEEWN